MSTSPLRPGSIRRLQLALANKKVSARELVQRSIDRVVDPTLNVLAAERFERALEEAALVDEGQRHGPLAGVPTLIKDLDDVEGLPTRQGSLLTSSQPATSDGVTTARLRDAGAIVVGKSTLPEFAIEGYTANRLTGVTTNPWNPRYSPGGSSGGSAAALSAGLATIATATDGGGSIRIPAALCGLVGLKPTTGLIGRYPAPDWIDLSTEGPFATSVDDLVTLVNLTLNPTAGDPAGLPRSSLRRPPFDRPRLIASWRSAPWGPVPSEIAAAFESALETLARLFRTRIIWVEPTTLFGGINPDDEWFTIAPVEHYHRLGADFLTEHWDELHVSSQEFFETAQRVSTERYVRARRRRFDLTRALDQLLGEDALWITPTLCDAGWLADGRLDEKAQVHGLPGDTLNTTVQNLTGHPALSVPMGRLANGLPFGVQITGPRLSDEWLLAVAGRIEKAQPWPERAPDYPSLLDVL